MPEMPTNADIMAGLGRLEERVAGIDTRLNERMQSLGREIGDLRSDGKVYEADLKALREHADTEDDKLRESLDGFVSWKHLSALLTLMVAAASILPLILHH